ncbi:MAG: membrane-bound PQQ-dependent dehydrogenase, glucose/quinate/shikimate family, partial [Pseudohongiellaceae bacterium]
MKPPRFLPIVLGLLGIGLTYLGLILLTLGGSFYYVVAGIALVASAVLVWRGDRRGAQLYGLLLLLTYLWSFYEIGLDAWALAPRVGLFTILGLWFLLPGVRRRLAGGETPPPLFRQRVNQATLGAAAVLVIALFIANTGYEVGTPAASGTGTVHNETGDWAHYGASKTGTRYASADQINRD